MSLSKDDVYTVLRTCQDPEIPVNIVDLGLVYQVDLQTLSASEPACEVQVSLTLTSPGCPMSHTISTEVHRKLLQLDHVKHAKVNLVWDPVWNPSMITTEGRKTLNLG